MILEELLTLLKDGKARSTLMLAAELNTSLEDVERSLEYLEQMGMLRRTVLGQVACGSCAGGDGCGAGEGAKGCGDGKTCAGCMPDGGFQNMGTLWEVVQ